MSPDGQFSTPCLVFDDATASNSSIRIDFQFTVIAGRSTEDAMPFRPIPNIHFQHTEVYTVAPKTSRDRRNSEFLRQGYSHVRLASLPLSESDRTKPVVNETVCDTRRWHGRRGIRALNSKPIRVWSDD